MKKKVILVSVSIILSLLIITFLASSFNLETSLKTDISPQHPETSQPEKYGLKIYGIVDYSTWKEQPYIYQGSIVKGKYEYSATVKFNVKNIGRNNLHELFFRYNTYDEIGHSWEYGFTHFSTITYFLDDLSIGETKTFTLPNFRLQWINPSNYQINGQFIFKCDETERGGICLNIRWNPKEPCSKDYVLSWLS